METQTKPIESEQLKADLKTSYLFLTRSKYEVTDSSKYAKLSEAKRLVENVMTELGMEVEQ